MKAESIIVNEREDAVIEFTTNKPMSKNDITAFFNAEKLIPVIKYSLEEIADKREFKLVVKECALQDIGEYKIVIKNASASTKLEVKGINF